MTLEGFRLLVHRFALVLDYSLNKLQIFVVRKPGSPAWEVDFLKVRHSMPRCMEANFGLVSCLLSFSVLTETLRSSRTGGFDSFESLQLLCM